MVKATSLAANGIDTIPYKIVSWHWTLIKGAGNALIVAPRSPATTVTGLKPGTYLFNLLTTDNNTGTQSANITLTVLPPAKKN